MEIEKNAKKEIDEIRKRIEPVKGKKWMKWKSGKRTTIEPDVLEFTEGCPPEFADFILNAARDMEMLMSYVAMLENMVGQEQAETKWKEQSWTDPVNDIKEWEKYTGTPYTGTTVSTTANVDASNAVWDTTTGSHTITADVYGLPKWKLKK